MIYLLYFAIAYLAVTSLVLLWNRRAFTPLLSADQKYFNNQAPSVSICIPARDEEDSIERCVQSALNQEYPNFEVLVLDDESTDGTPQILRELQENHPRSLQIIGGRPKPADWLGKPWACQQLSKEAEGDILLFIDADTQVHPKLTAKAVRTMGHHVVDFITVWPMQKLDTFWEKTVIPLIYYALLSLLPARYVYRAPRWLPSRLRKRLSPLFAAACGQCMAFKREAYRAIGGHRSVKQEVVEDLQLARRVKRHGLRMRMYHGLSAVSCRMYKSEGELHEGFSKNFLAGFGNSLTAFILAGILHLLVYLLPFLLLPTAWLSGWTNLALLSFIAVAITLWHRVILARWFEWSIPYALLHPLAVLWFQKLAIESVILHLRGEEVRWKGRSL